MLFQNVNLRLGSKFRNRFATMELERKESPYVSHSSLSEEERKNRLLQHLDKHGCITRSDYEAITGRAKHQAVAGTIILKKVSYVNMAVTKWWFIRNLDIVKRNFFNWRFVFTFGRENQIEKQ